MIDRFKIKNQYLLWISISVSFIVIGIYYYSLLRYGVNFPKEDDYEAIIEFLIKYDSTPNWGDRIKLLTTQHNEHRIFFDRVTALIYYKVFDDINFIALSFIGSLSLLCFGFFLFKSVDSFKRNVLYVIPVIFFLFSFKFSEIIFWAMASLQNLWVLVFAFVSFYYLNKEKNKHLVIACIAALLATYTSGNGVMTFVAGAFVLVVNKKYNYKLIIWILFFCISVCLYFFNYTKPSNHPDILQPLLDNPWAFFSYGFAFIGSFGNTGVMGAIVYGIVIFLCILILFIKKYNKANPVVFSFMVFLLLTALVNSLGRFGFGVEVALSLRYVINSILLVICVYVALIELCGDLKLGKYLFFPFVLAYSVYLYFWSYNTFLTVAISKKEIFNYQIDLLKKGEYASFDYGTVPFSKAEPKRYLKLADSMGIFKFPYTEQLPDIQGLPVYSGKTMHYLIDYAAQVDTSFKIIGWIFMDGQTEPMFTAVRIESEAGKIEKEVLCARRHREDVANVHIPGSFPLKLAGFCAEVPVKDLPKGRYGLTLLMIDKKGIAIQKTDTYFQKK